MWAGTVALILTSLLLSLPVVVTILNSFRPTSEIFLSQIGLPTNPEWANFGKAVEGGLLRQLLNSLVVVAASTLLILVAGSLAGYALSRFTGRLISTFGSLLLLFAGIPLVLMLIPLFVTFVRIGFFGGLIPVIIVYSSLFLPVAIWMFTGIFDSIPLELEEAAWVDGANRVAALRRIVLPIARPTLLTVALFVGILGYHEYLVASVFIREPQLLTVSVGLQRFVDENASNWGPMMAATTLAMLPILVFILFMQRHMETFISGSVKG